MNSYTKSDLRSLELHKKIVEKLQQTPALWDVVFENINLLSETTENGQRLRSSSAFSRILSEEEKT